MLRLSKKIQPMSEDEPNPYESPRQIANSEEGPLGNTGGIDKFAIIAWPVVFGLNIIIPAWFGWAVTGEHGRIGLCLASALFLASGWVLCYVRPAITRRLILGALVFAPSQFIPVVQIVAGIIAFIIAGALGLTGPDNDEPTGEFGGFVITFIVGGILLMFAGVIGWIVGLILPQSWQSRNGAFNIARRRRRELQFGSRAK
ncbi:MAG: hypothetical protein KY475_24250 [Planctomycetes bacterium]|nr:hypothetical protein [Planctomycetota bacterium]